MNNRNISLDLLRGLCILYIVGFWHMFNYTAAFPQYSNILTLRVTGVILATFTFLSGYFIGRKGIDFKKETIVKFFYNRILRIYPLYFVALIIYFSFGMSDFFTSIKAAVAVSMFFRPAPPTLWFIVMLLFFYLISPLLVIKTKNGHIILVWTAYIFVSATLLIINIALENLDVRVITYFPAFFLGIITAIKGEVYINKREMALFFLIGLIISFAFNQNYLPYDWLLSTILVSTGSYFIFIFFRNKINPPKLASFPVTVIAYSSYCMYLFHRPIYMVLKAIYFPNCGIAQILYLVLFCLPCILICSYSLQKYQDNLIKLLTKRFTELAESRR